MGITFDNPHGRPARKRVHPEPVRRSRTVWDKAVFDSLVSHVGVEKMDASLRMFSASLSQKSLILQDRGIAFARKRQEVHDLASGSGFLGFEALFQACLAFLADHRSSLSRPAAVVSEIEIVLEELTPHLAALPRTN